MSRWVILQSRPRGSFINGKTKANIGVLFNLIYLIIRHETSKRNLPLCQLLIRKKAFFIRLPLKRKIVPICQLCLKAGQNKFQHQTEIKSSFLSKTFSASLSKLLANAVHWTVSSAALDLNVSSSHKVAYRAKPEKFLDVKMPFRDKTSLIYYIYQGHDQTPPMYI